MISVLLVDDHPVVVEGIRRVLETSEDISVAGVANDASSALEQARLLKPDVILLDLRMPGASGVQATRRLREQDVRSAVIILTSYGDQAYVRQALEAGADGYLLKSTPPDQLISAIRSAVRGRRQLSPELLDAVLEDFKGLAREQTRRDADLSDEDREIVKLAARGLHQSRNRPRARPQRDRHQEALAGHLCQARRDRPRACGGRVDTAGVDLRSWERGARS